MKCMKTGIKFQVHPMSAIYHADMYYCQDLNCFVIRVLAPGESNQIPDIILAPVTDTFFVQETSIAFLSWWHEWNPSIQLPGTPIIIADSRF